jgi:hypothetical protein
MCGAFFAGARFSRRMAARDVGFQVSPLPLCVKCLIAPATVGVLHGNSVHLVACQACAPGLAGSECAICHEQAERTVAVAAPHSAAP